MKSLSLPLFFIFVLSFNFIYSKSVLDVVAENKELSSFYEYLKKSDLDDVLKKKLPWNWTIFAPSNKAFENIIPKLKSKVLEDDNLRKKLFMDHIMTGHKTSLDFSEDISTEITVSNKSIQIYKMKKLHVKDMVVINENLIGENGVVHIIDCIMFVQPSEQDSRLSLQIQKDFPITSCCMESDEEVSLWISTAEDKF